MNHNCGGMSQGWVRDEISANPNCTQGDDGGANKPIHAFLLFAGVVFSSVQFLIGISQQGPVPKNQVQVSLTRFNVMAEILEDICFVARCSESCAACTGSLTMYFFPLPRHHRGTLVVGFGKLFVSEWPAIGAANISPWLAAGNSVFIMRTCCVP